MPSFDARIDTLGHQCSGLISTDAGVTQANGWVDAHRDARLLSVPGETVVPRLRTILGDVQEQAVRILQGVWLVFGPGLPGRSICEGHLVHPVAIEFPMC
ncbi:hypothetical protein D3C81_1953020 [compost metagenome]